MSQFMADPSLRLCLGSAQSLPAHLGWRIEDGYVRMIGWGDQAELITLGIWGPGDLVLPSLLSLQPIELLTLSAVQVVAITATLQEERSFLIDQAQQAASLLLLSRVRPVESRLFRLLLWLGQRFGRVSRRGVSLSLREMNLTHRHLAELLVREGEDELLVDAALPD